MPRATRAPCAPCGSVRRRPPPLSPADPCVRVRVSLLACVCAGRGLIGDLRSSNAGLTDYLRKEVSAGLSRMAVHEKYVPMVGTLTEEEDKLLTMPARSDARLAARPSSPPL